MACVGVVSVLALIVLVLPNVSVAAPTLQFSFGTVEGLDIPDFQTTRLMYGYFGIPFAEPPVGSLRFQPPQPYRGTGRGRVITSDTYRPACMQQRFPGDNTEISEDCLHLNVFVPGTDTGRLKKVMVWIHGGGYVVGGAHVYDGTRLVIDYDVIGVVIQYRLGVFGFLSTGDEALPGNNGLRDQILALQWVKDNIRQFGGDPDDVTILGESAGGSSVGQLSLSPLTKGLFTKAILMSGTATANFALVEKSRAEDVFTNVAERTGCQNWFHSLGIKRVYHETVLKCLRRLPAEVLNRFPEYPQTLLTIEEYLYRQLDFVPVVDGDLLPKHPSILLKDKNYLRRAGVLDRSYVIGLTNCEGYLHLELMLPLTGGTIKNFTEPKNADLLIAADARSQFPLGPGTVIKDFIDFTYTYPRERDGGIAAQSLINFLTDTGFVVPAVNLARDLTSASPDTDVFFYLFDHYPQWIDPNSPVQGTTHAMDLAYLFDASEYWRRTYSYADVYGGDAVLVSNVYRELLTEFAKTGRPSTALPGGGRVAWPRFQLGDEQFMAISGSPEVRRAIYAKRVSLWTEFFPQRGRRSFLERLMG